MNLLLVAAIAVGVAVLGVWGILRYADRAIRERRPGWAPQTKGEGIYCPGAVGEKGEPGPPGQENP